MAERTETLPGPRQDVAEALRSQDAQWLCPRPCEASGPRHRRTHEPFIWGPRGSRCAGPIAERARCTPPREEQPENPVGGEVQACEPSARHPAPSCSAPRHAGAQHTRAFAHVRAGLSHVGEDEAAAPLSGMGVWGGRYAALEG